MTLLLHYRLLARLLCSGAACACGVACLPAAAGASAAPRPNVLFFAADDLRTDLGCYGGVAAKTPHIDALARQGVLFERAYCQQAVCNPSRASLLTGLRPDTIKVWDLRRHFRETLPDVVTLPQYFKQQGYAAIGIGKIFHNESGAKPPFPFADPVSWSEPPVFAEGPHWRDWVVLGDPAGPKVKGGAVQCLDVPDEAYLDGRIAAAAVAKLGALARAQQPFFLGVGFWKPHLPFNAPKRYWDLYERAKISPPEPARLPAGAPAIAGHEWKELRGYQGVPRQGPLPATQIAELRHGYLACISFLDAQVGRVLSELARLDLAKNTIVVIWGDNGFHLGEHDLWGKTTNYELDTRVPLIVVAPGVTRGGGRVAAPTELLNLYPTLVELCGLPPAPDLEGRSLGPQLRDPRQQGADVAVSQHPHPSYGQATHMGYSVRTSRHRYVEWHDLATGVVTNRELYDHETDPAETHNRIADPAQSAAVKDLESRAARFVAAGGKGWMERAR
jgi:iduronate 2-sulfatase